MSGTYADDLVAPIPGEPCLTVFTDGVGMHAKFRRKGLGTALMTASLVRAAQNKMERLILEVDIENHQAIALTEFDSEMKTLMKSIASGSRSSKHEAVLKAHELLKSFLPRVDEYLEKFSADEKLDKAFISPKIDYELIGFLKLYSPLTDTSESNIK